MILSNPPEDDSEWGDSGDVHKPRPTSTSRVRRVCEFGCPDPDYKGHLNHCIYSTWWDSVGGLDDEKVFETCCKLHAHMVGIEAALASRDYNPRNN